MTVCKGVVKDNVVLLEAGAQLPDGAEVEIRLLEHPLTRPEVFARVHIHRTPRPVGMDEIIAEDKHEREEHPNRHRSWRRPPQLLLWDVKAPNYRMNKAFEDSGRHSEWPKVADTVIEAAYFVLRAQLGH